MSLFQHDSDDGEAGNSLPNPRNIQQNKSVLGVSLNRADSEEAALLFQSRRHTAGEHPGSGRGSPEILSKRIRCLDALRGLAISAMVIVNSGKFTGNWAWIAHSPWNGLHLADIVMPMFLFR